MSLGVVELSLVYALSGNLCNVKSFTNLKSVFECLGGINKVDIYCKILFIIRDLNITQPYLHSHGHGFLAINKLPTYVE